jgi:hypothetical protein
VKLPNLERNTLALALLVRKTVYIRRRPPNAASGGKLIWLDPVRTF